MIVDNNRWQDEARIFILVNSKSAAPNYLENPRFSKTIGSRTSFDIIARRIRHHRFPYYYIISSLLYNRRTPRIHKVLKRPTRLRVPSSLIVIILWQSTHFARNNNNSIQNRPSFNFLLHTALLVVENRFDGRARSCAYEHNIINILLYYHNDNMTHKSQSWS